MAGAVPGTDPGQIRQVGDGIEHSIFGTMKDSFVIDALRTPIGKYGGILSSVRPDDLLAHMISELVGRFPGLDLEKIEEVIAGDANQSGEDNRNVARMALLLAGLPV